MRDSGRSVLLREEVIEEGVESHGEKWDRVLTIEVQFHDASWGSQKGYWLHVRVELTKVEDGVRSMLIRLGRGSTKHLLQPAARFNRKELERQADRAKTSPVLETMLGLVMPQPQAAPIPEGVSSEQ